MVTFVFFSLSLLYSMYFSHREDATPESFTSSQLIDRAVRQAEQTGYSVDQLVFINYWTFRLQRDFANFNEMGQVVQVIHNYESNGVTIRTSQGSVAYYSIPGRMLQEFCGITVSYAMYMDRNAVLYVGVRQLLDAFNETAESA